MQIRRFSLKTEDLTGERKIGRQVLKAEAFRSKRKSKQVCGGDLEVPGLCPTMMFVENVDEAISRHRRSTLRDAATQTDGMDVTVYLQLL